MPTPQHENDMLDLIIKKFFIKPESSKKDMDKSTYLPPINITSQCQLKLDQLYYQFLLKMYLEAASQKPSISFDDQIYFLQEIALYQKIINPEKSRTEYEQNIICLATEFERLSKISK